MSLVAKLISFGFRQVIGVVATDETCEMAAEAGGIAAKVAGHVIDLVKQHFTDHSQILQKALSGANDRSWQALSISLAGDGFLDQVKVFFASGDDKGIREQVRLFLQDMTITFEGTPQDFPKKCLAELNQAKKAGLLTAQNLSPTDVARQTASFQRYTDPKGLVDGAEQVIGQIADELASEHPNLAKLLRQRPSGGPPLLVSAFAYFFRREVETNEELAHGLFFDGLRQLSASQANGFGEVNKALTSLGDQFDQIIESLARIETIAVKTHGAVLETHVAVLDMQVELQRQGNLYLANANEVCRLTQEVHNLVIQAGMQKGEVKFQHSFSICTEDELIAVKQLLARFRQLPLEQQKQVPALLNGLGKLQFGSGDFGGARASFETASQSTTDATAQAEAQFNAYRAALEEKKWDDALAAIQKAVSLDSQRFAPFPMQRYQPKQLLGSGGFGAAFLCHDRYLNAEVVVKTLHDDAMECKTMTDVFREAQVLGQLHHPAIIGVRDCNYGDFVRFVRPYIVMDYFPGGSLEDFIQQRGTLSSDDLLIIALQIAQGMQAAHQQNIFHRDLKPDNILVRNEGSSWKVKIIDFGLALRKETNEKSTVARIAGNSTLGEGVAGTMKYAPPEQTGELKGVKVGPYSDVYAFGKMCCYAMFETTEPTDRLWKTVPEYIRTDLREMLDQCREKGLEHRLPSFEPVLKVLEGLDPNHIQRKKEEFGRQKADLERKRREQDEADRQQKELERLQKEGETKLIQFVREALDQTEGKHTQDDSTAAIEICKRHSIDKERTKQIVEGTKKQWQNAQPKEDVKDQGIKQKENVGIGSACTQCGHPLVKEEYCTVCGKVVWASIIGLIVVGFVMLGLGVGGILSCYYNLYESTTMVKLCWWFGAGIIGGILALVGFGMPIMACTYLAQAAAIREKNKTERRGMD